MTEKINLWLDDVRPAPWGWTLVKTDAEARWYLERGLVQTASLDHDLGACEDCMGGNTVEQWLEKFAFRSMPNCDHFGTGYTLVCWMEETGNWPKEKPKVHSANPVGRAKMEVAINRHFDRG